MLDSLQPISDSLRKAPLFAKRREAEPVQAVKDVATNVIPLFADRKRCKHLSWVECMGEIDHLAADMESS